MAFDDLRQLARGALVDIANCIWPDDQADTLARREEELRERIRQGYDELLRHRRVAQSIQQRVEAQERQAAALPWHVDTYLQVGNKPAAWRSAMELDRVRTMLQQDKARLARLAKEQATMVERVERQKQRLGDIQRQLLHVEPSLRTV